MYKRREDKLVARGRVGEFFFHLKFALVNSRYSNTDVCETRNL